MSPLSGLPAIADSALPREIRDGSAADKKAYKAAMGFEQLFVGQLVQEMTKGSSLAEGERAGATADAMTDAIEGAGGLGLADHLYAAMKLQTGSR
jgi:Rod binding domain-containing protein